MEEKLVNKEQVLRSVMHRSPLTAISAQLQNQMDKVLSKTVAT